ncbi:hypothetical protein P692DRAFT_20522782 [Suillus brevipes Sb2]|nr:hypothetical protein P692DRAFT_20522782 [Suillus brevipes Sb2]
MHTKNSPLKEPVLRDIQPTTIALSDNHSPELPSANELCPSIPDTFHSHKQDPGLVQNDLKEDDNNINGNMHYVPHDVPCAPRPMPANVSTVLARDDATRIPRVLPTFDYTPTSTESNGTALRATLPAPFTYCIPREFVEAEGIIPEMIHQRLVDLHGMPMQRPPFFNMPDTRLYAQFISNSCQHKDAVTRQYYSKVPRNPCFPDDLQCPRIYPLELLKQLPNHLERYKDAFPKPLPTVIIRNDEIICMDPPLWHMHGVIMHVPPTEHPPNPEDTLWSMCLKRGVSASYRRHSGGQSHVATSPVQFGNMIYSAEELTYFDFAVNVFIEVPRLPWFELDEPEAAYKGAFILKVVDYPMDPTCWTELTEDRKMDIFERAPQLFGGIPTFSKCPTFPAVNLHFQNWDMNLLGVLDDLEFGAVDDSIGVASARNGNQDCYVELAEP